MLLLLTTRGGGSQSDFDVPQTDYIGVIADEVINPRGNYAHCCHMATAIKRPVPDRVEPSFAIFDIRAL